MRQISLLALIGIPLFSTGCFQDLFARGVGWQATRYLNTWPRIVGLDVNPRIIEPTSEEYSTSALVLLPPGSKLESVTLSTCGLGRDTQTFLWDLGCFEDENEIQLLAQQDSLPLKWVPPPTPALEPLEDTGDSGYGGYDSGLYGFWYGSRDVTVHTLPLLLNAVVDGEDVWAATLVDWHTQEVRDNPFDIPLSQLPMRLEVPEKANAGDEITATFFIESDLRWNTWHWYIDAGVLRDTGVTTGHTYSPPATNLPQGMTTSSNRWILPQEPGTYRIWAVLTGRPNEMAWREATVEVR